MSPNIRHSLSFEYALLGFLRSGPLHGYQIYQELRDPSGLGLIWRLKQSQLYALLARLEDEGYISAELQVQETRPTRKEYHLTPQGQDAFLKWVQNPVPVARRIRQEFLAKLYFARREGPEISARLIERQRATCQSWLADLNDSVPPSASQETQPWLIYQYRLHHVRAIIDWLGLCELAVIQE